MYHTKRQRECGTIRNLREYYNTTYIIYPQAGENEKDEQQCIRLFWGGPPPPEGQGKRHLQQQHLRRAHSQEGSEEAEFETLDLNNTATIPPLMPMPMPMLATMP